MVFEQNKTYTHEAMRDVFILVNDVRESREGLMLKVSWWNRGQSGQAYPMGTSTEIMVLNEELPKWRKYDR